MSSDTDTHDIPQMRRPYAHVCAHSGLSKPECHCQACLRDLIARFGPASRD